MVAILLAAAGIGGCKERTLTYEEYLLKPEKLAEHIALCQGDWAEAKAQGVRCWEVKQHAQAYHLVEYNAQRNASELASAAKQPAPEQLDIELQLKLKRTGMERCQHELSTEKCRPPTMEADTGY